MRQSLTACQVCGATATGYEWWRDFEEVQPMAEAWPGGPLVPDFTTFREMRPTTSHIKLEPCGHEQPDVDAVRIAYLEVDSARE